MLQVEFFTYTRPYTSLRDMLIKKSQNLIPIRNRKLQFIAECSSYETEHLSLAVQSEMLNLTRCYRKKERSSYTTGHLQVRFFRESESFITL